MVSEEQRLNREQTNDDDDGDGDDDNDNNDENDDDGDGDVHLALLLPPALPHHVVHKAGQSAI